MTNTEYKAIKAAIITTALLVFASIANAETFYQAAQPTNTIKTSEAAHSKTPVCQWTKVHQGPNINPVKVPGSKTLWSKAEGVKGVDDVAALFDGGKAAWRCKTMELDSSSGRMKSAAL